MKFAVVHAICFIMVVMLGEGEGCIPNLKILEIDIVTT